MPVPFDLELKPASMEASPVYDVAVVRYERPFESLKKAVDLVGGIEGISPDSKVVIKPNYVMWLEGMDFPKYGVLTTARLIEDIVVLLKEHGVKNISIVEGPTETGTVSLFHLAVKGMWGLTSLPSAMASNWLTFWKDHSLG